MWASTNEPNDQRAVAGQPLHGLVGICLSCEGLAQQRQEEPKRRLIELTQLGQSGLTVGRQTLPRRFGLGASAATRAASKLRSRERSRMRDGAPRVGSMPCSRSFGRTAMPGESRQGVFAPTFSSATANARCRAGDRANAARHNR